MTIDPEPNRLCPPHARNGQGEISRRQLIGGGLGLAASGLLGACASPLSSAFSLVQSAEGRRATSGRSISAQYTNNVKVGSLLVAVVTRQSTGSLAPTIGQVSDDQGNHWRQAVEYFSGGHYGVDLWYCESAEGVNRPTVTGTGPGFPVLPGYTGLKMALFEYSGASGYELCDQICQADIIGTSVTATTNFDLTSNHELAISVIMGDMTAVSAPSGWSVRLADTTQKCYAADNLDTGGSSAGSRLSARWTGLTHGTAGVAVMATFVPTGLPATSRRLVQSSYTDSSILPVGQGHNAWTSQAYPVDPKLGNTLVTFVNGAIYNPSIDCGSVVSVTDSAGGVWYHAGESGIDNHTGINISCWVCESAVGGDTRLTVNFSNASQQLACLLLEFANPSSVLHVASVGARSFGGDLPHLRASPRVSTGDLAFAFRTSIYVLPEGPGVPGWKQIMSDTTGANCLMMLRTPTGELTAVWEGSVVGGGVDILVLALKSAGSFVPS